LTSHFANNTVTLNDFELAEHMNQMFDDTKSTFAMFPRFTERSLLSLSVGVGGFVMLVSFFNLVTSYGYESDV